MKKRKEKKRKIGILSILLLYYKFQNMHIIKIQLPTSYKYASYTLLIYKQTLHSFLKLCGQINAKYRDMC